MLSQFSEKAKHGLRIMRTIIANLGFDPIKALNSLRAIPNYFIELNLFKKLLDPDFLQVSYFPCLSDRYEQSGSARGHYFHQDLLVAQKIYTNKPQRHVDIGSRIDGFVAHVASFREIEVFDIRPNKVAISNILFQQIDFMEPLPAEWHNYSDSVSCLHALEHFGLGRYGDPIDPSGFRKGLANLHKLCKVGGKVYLGLPIGEQRVEFNAHRVFSTSYLFSHLQKDYQILSFSFVDDHGDLHSNITPSYQEIAQNFGCHFGCAILELTKL